MPKPARNIAAALTRKGFRSHHGDHVYYYLYVGDKKTSIRTKISHGENEIGENLLAVMARQVKLTKKLFGDLVDCPLTHDQYVKILQHGGHVAKNDPGNASGH